MRSIALLTALAITGSTAAYAEPARDRYGHDEQERTREPEREGNLSRDRYDHYAHSRWAHDFHGRWVPITAGKSQAGRTDFFLPAKQHYKRLRIESTRGEPVISQVTIEFANGTNQSVAVNSRLPTGAGEVIDLTGESRVVTRVIVDADAQSHGQFTVYGA